MLATILNNVALLADVKEFLTKKISLGDKLYVPFWGVIVASIAVIVFIILATVLILQTDKEKKERAAAKEKAEENAENAQQVEYVDEYVDEPAAQTEEEGEESAQTPVEESAEEVEEPVQEVKEEPVQEVKEEAIQEVKEEPVQEEKPEEPAAEEIVIEEVEEEQAQDVAADVAEPAQSEEPAEKPAKKAQTAPKKETAKKAAPAKKQAETIDVPLFTTPVKEKKKATPQNTVAESNAETEEKAATEPETVEPAKRGAIGKYELTLRSEGYCFSLIANNGQLLYDSFGYSSLEGAKAGIETFKKAVKEGNFFASGDKFGRYRFILNKRYQGQNYSSKAACESSIKSVIRFAENAKINEPKIEEEDIAAYNESLKLQKKATDIDWEKVAEEEAATPRLGTFESYEDENGDFRFYLIANNGQILYTSSVYASASTVRNAIDNFKKAVYIGNFVIGKDKFGKFRYILRSSSAVTYVGESYTTEAQAKKSSESVKRFVKSASILPCNKYVPEE